MKMQIGYLMVDGEIKDVMFDESTSVVTYHNEDDIVNYELMIPVEKPIAVTGALLDFLTNGGYGEAIGVIMSGEGVYVIVDENTAELRPLSDVKGRAIQTFQIDLYMEAEDQDLV